MKLVIPKNIYSMSKEWDKIASKRQLLIEQQKDLSLITVNTPLIIKEIINSKSKNVLDVGCGSGYLTNEISKIADYCVGIDISKNSIYIANKKYKRDNLKFIYSSLEQFKTLDIFDTCVSNMSFSSDPNFIDSLNIVYEKLPLNGIFLINIPHPCFWAKYWNIVDQEWFRYDSELFIEHSFSMSMVKDLGVATYIHRPLSTYINNIIRTGFLIENMIEVQGADSNPNHKFLFLKLVKK